MLYGAVLVAVQVWKLEQIGWDLREVTGDSISAGEYLQAHNMVLQAERPPVINLQAFACTCTVLNLYEQRVMTHMLLWPLYR